jgi:hypothetical protein
MEDDLGIIYRQIDSYVTKFRTTVRALLRQPGSCHPSPDGATRQRREDFVLEK